MRCRNLVFGLVALLALVFAMPTGAVEAPNAASQKHFFWKVTGPKGVVYLLGTIHVGKADFYPLAPVIEQSFEKSDVLITEAEIGGPEEAPRVLKMLLQKGVYPAGDSVENHIGEQTRARLTRYVANSKELASDYQRLKPWFLSLAIELAEVKRMGFDESKGLDKHFADEAAAMHKPTGTLETGEAQLQTMSSFSEELQDQLLLSSLLEVDHKDEIMDRMLRAWKTGDAEAMEESNTRDLREHPLLKPVYEKLFDQRNDAMTQKIAQFLDTPKTYFVAVGAGHLVGERGILSQLRGRHYTVERPEALAATVRPGFASK